MRLPFKLLLKVAFLSAVVGATFFALAPQGLSPDFGASDPVTHGLAFFVLAAIGAIAFPALSLTRLWLCLALLGGAIELMQAIPALNRGPSFAEWLIDMVAAAVALGCCHVGTFRARSNATGS